jgi:hypothetical protein
MPRCIGPEDPIDRPRVRLDGRLALQQPHHHVEGVGARDDHGRDRLRAVGAAVIVDGDQAVHEGPRGRQRHLAELTGPDLLLGAQETPAEALRVADHRVGARALDRGQDARGLRELGRQRLLDQEVDLALDGGENRIDVQMLVGRDDRRADFRPRQELAMVGGDEVGADPRRHVLAAVGTRFGDADPVDVAVPRGDLAANQSDAAGADDGETDASGCPRPHFGLTG